MLGHICCLFIHLGSMIHFISQMLRASIWHSLPMFLFLVLSPLMFMNVQNGSPFIMVLVIKELGVKMREYLNNCNEVFL